MMGMSSHQRNGGHDEWLTPPEILAPLGRFDLDPCAPITRPWDTAARHYDNRVDGLSCEWSGRVWCNPPFGREAVRWLRKMAQHGNGIALIPARTETAMFYECVWGVADAILWLRGRLTFFNVDGTRPKNSGGAPSVLIAYGRENAGRLHLCGLQGRITPA